MSTTNSFHVEVRQPEPKPKIEGGNRRALAPMSLQSLHLLMRLPPNVHIEMVLSDDFDRTSGMCSLILTGDGLPDDFIIEPDGYPKAAKFVCKDNGKQFPDFDCSVLLAE